MKLWLITQDFNDGYDTYDSAVVAAPDAEAARRIHPNGYDGEPSWRRDFSTWARPDKVSATLIGEAADGVTGVVCASFNAG